MVTVNPIFHRKMSTILGCRGITLEDELTVCCNIHAKEFESRMTTVQAPSRIPRPIRQPISLVRDPADRP